MSVEQKCANRRVFRGATPPARNGGCEVLELRPEAIAPLADDVSFVNGDPR